MGSSDPSNIIFPFSKESQEEILFVLVLSFFQWLPPSKFKLAAKKSSFQSFGY